MTTLPLTDWMGSMTSATARLLSCSKLCCVLMSTPESQQPKPGWLWYLLRLRLGIGLGLGSSLGLRFI